MEGRNEFNRAAIEAVRRSPKPVPLPSKLFDWIRYPTQRRAFETLLNQRFRSFPWLAEAWADYLALQFLREAQALALKKNPAPSAAARVREMATRAAAAEHDAREAKYTLAYYQQLFPFLIEIQEEQEAARLAGEEPPLFAESGEDHDDPARRWLTDDEYRRLPSAAKYQLALDRYWSKPKSRWEVGRDYERFVGQRYERDGYAVRYHGIIEGLADFGRDLIATSDSEAIVVQCKCWAEHRTIHEKHIFQLLGTALAFRLENPTFTVRAVFVTSTSLSDRARSFAEQLSPTLQIDLIEGLKLERYECVKCNVSRRTGEKIYHLPFDQQYDAVVIEEERLERFVQTVAEAEKLGFRRAKRWLGADS